nr:hypothetical protein Iba_chr02bCG10750 [Ipomoea batatas]
MVELAEHLKLFLNVEDSITTDALVTPEALDEIGCKRGPSPPPQVIVTKVMDVSSGEEDDSDDDLVELWESSSPRRGGMAYTGYCWFKIGMAEFLIEIRNRPRFFLPSGQKDDLGRGLTSIKVADLGRDLTSAKIVLSATRSVKIVLSAIRSALFLLRTCL